VKKKKNKNKWIKKRHSFFRLVLGLPVFLITWFRYKVKLRKAKLKGPHFILYNHQTAFDQFFVACAFSKPVYFVCSEDLFSNGFLSKLIAYLVAPIPFRKSTADIASIKNCYKVAREGGHIAISPEGNRTYSGTTEDMKPAIADMVKFLKLPVAIFKIEGGYGVHPRWSDTLRKGRVSVGVSRVISPEEYEKMSNDELFEVIKKELYVDEREDKNLYYGKKNAEYLERVMYYCPYCGITHFESQNDIVTCKNCSRQIKYLPSKQLEGVGFDFPYPYVKEWYDAQCDFIRKLDVTPFMDTPLYEETAKYSENIYCAKKVVKSDGAVMRAYGDRLVVSYDGKEDVYMYDDISSATVLGRNKLNIYVGKQIFQFKGDKQFNAVKFLNLYFHARNSNSNGEHSDFLGL